MITYKELVMKVAEKLKGQHKDRLPNLTADDWKHEAGEILGYILQNGEAVPNDENATRFFIPSEYEEIFGAVGSIISYDEEDEHGNVLTVGYELD